MPLKDPYFYQNPTMCKKHKAKNEEHLEKRKPKNTLEGKKHEPRASMW